MSGDRQFAVKLYPGGQVVMAKPGQVLSEVLALTGWRLETPCAGLGTCGKCRVEVSPQLEPNDAEAAVLSPAEIAAGVRLACQVPVDRSLEVRVPVPTREVCRKTELIISRTVNPAAGRTDWGLALDVGTTTIAGSLVDLSSGQRLAAAARLNPQAVHGADVMSRLAYAMVGAGARRQLREEAVAGVNEIIDELLATVRLPREALREGVVVGNTAMHHLLLGLDTTSLSQYPYQPVVSRAVWAVAEELGLHLSAGTSLHFLPNIGGFVGGDTVAVLLAIDLVRSRSVQLVLDIGTNGEIMLGSRDGIWVCSTAAGPAFEGGRITHGLRAVAGAIETVRIINNEVEIGVIGGSPAAGVTGSGLIQAVAELNRVGLVDDTGRLLDAAEAPVDDKLRSRLTVTAGEREFILVPAGNSAHGRAIVVTQQDIRELQLGKGAIRAGVENLIRELSVPEADIAQVVLAGTFGNYLDVSSAARLGLIPPGLADRVRLAGNAALQGAELALASPAARDQAEQIARSAKHIELAGRADFAEAFIKYLNFGF